MPAPHPAKFPFTVLEAARPWLAGLSVLDPFAGVGRIHLLADGEHPIVPAVTVGVELEPEWAGQHPRTIVGDATRLPFADASFDAVFTSPCYGNRMADHHEARDPSKRHTYRHYLERPLTPGNAGALQWGDAYRQLHRCAYREVGRVVGAGGLALVNVKDHRRKGERAHVAGWTVAELVRCGFDLLEHVEVESHGQRHGANGHGEGLRYAEQLYVLRRVAE